MLILYNNKITSFLLYLWVQFQLPYEILYLVILKNARAMFSSMFRMPAHQYWKFTAMDMQNLKIMVTFQLDVSDSLYSIALNIGGLLATLQIIHRIGNKIYWSYTRLFYPATDTIYKIKEMNENACPHKTS